MPIRLQEEPRPWLKNDRWVKMSWMGRLGIMILIAMSSACHRRIAYKMPWPASSSPQVPDMRLRTKHALLPATVETIAYRADHEGVDTPNTEGDLFSFSWPQLDIHSLPPPASTRLRFHWPLAATGVSSLFGSRRHPITGQESHHYGVDLTAEYGTVVETTSAGTVTFAGHHGGHGRMIVVRHQSGFVSSYSHLSQIIVQRGMKVNSRQAIGLVGNSGRSTGAHLHFELKRWERHVDPLDYLGLELEVDENDS